MTEPSFDLLRDDFASRFVDGSPEAVRPLLREACELFEEARGVFERLDAESGLDWSEAMPADLARFERVLVGSTRFDYSRPGELDLVALRMSTQAPRAWSDAVLLAGLALVAARYAAECADDAAELVRYLGAAREALALADSLDAEARARADFTRPAAQAKRGARAARIADFAQRWRESVAADPAMKQLARLHAIGADMRAGLSTVESYLAEARALGLVTDNRP